MTPAEHHAEAERLLGWAHEDDPDLSFGDRELAVIEAKVHATLALSPAAPPLPRPKPKPPARVEVFDVELNHLHVTTTDDGSVVLDHPATDWSTLLDDPAQVRLLADTLTAHADRMENS